MAAALAINIKEQTRWEMPLQDPQAVGALRAFVEPCFPRPHPQLTRRTRLPELPCWLARCTI